MVRFTLDTKGAPFDLSHTLESGQVFRWEKSFAETEGGRRPVWLGVLPEGVVRVSPGRNGILTCSSSSRRIGAVYLRGYFRLDDDLPRFYSSAANEPGLREAIRRFYGLHLIRQNIWECMLSFVVATNANIPRIRLMLSRLSDRFGEETKFEERTYRLFPSPGALAAASVEDLARCGLGYRASFVRSVALSVTLGSIDLDELVSLDYTSARDRLVERSRGGPKTLPGIGRKVADCVLLFSCGKDTAFPIDVWMARVLRRAYPYLLGEEIVARLDSKTKNNKVALSPQVYDRIAAIMREYFGRYAGYAQQYLYHNERMGRP